MLSLFVALNNKQKIYFFITLHIKETLISHISVSFFITYYQIHRKLARKEKKDETNKENSNSVFNKQQAPNHSVII